jgi:hypothetical protein
MRTVGDGITAMLVLKMAPGSCFPVDRPRFHMDQEVNFSISREPMTAAGMFLCILQQQQSHPERHGAKICFNCYPGGIACLQHLCCR